MNDDSVSSPSQPKLSAFAGDPAISPCTIMYIHVRDYFPTSAYFPTSVDFPASTRNQERTCDPCDQRGSEDISAIAATTEASLPFDHLRPFLHTVMHRHCFSDSRLSTADRNPNNCLYLLRSSANPISPRYHGVRRTDLPSAITTPRCTGPAWRWSSESD
jgi:hypothetical protein